MTVKQLEAGIEAYFTECEANGIFPDYAGMKLHLGVSEERLDKLCKDPRRGKKYAELLRRAKDRRESWLVRKLPEKGSSRGCLSLLSRDENGGYTQLCEGTQGIRLTIDLEALGGIVSAK